jgi:hypothetical protein
MAQSTVLRKGVNKIIVKMKKQNTIVAKLLNPFAYSG